MGNNLRDRLRRIRDAGYRAGGGETGRRTVRETGGETGTVPSSPEAEDRPFALPGPGWEAAGFRTLRRGLRLDLPRPLPPGPLREPPKVLRSGTIPADLPLLVPDLFRYAAGGNGAPGLGDLLFFDLETTGLSGGAGTVAFLAAFGRFALAETGEGETGGARGNLHLQVTQYLLLDYPGEHDFLEILLREWEPGEGGNCPLTVTYNGKSFDSQIVKTRCLMNGFAPPVFYHADLLHPCRRLWKRVLPDCSQGTVETLILGLDRSGDTPGEQAPDIWFSFLRSGDPSALSGICDHNVKDIAGLAVLFLALADIAEQPLEAEETRRCDAERLALCWRRSEGPWGPLLLRRAAARGSPWACRQLAMEAEWRRGDYGEALVWTERGLASADLREGLRKDLSHRRERLAARLRNGGGCADGCAT
jgi:uncharacterized protein YprB with RNaseH-like and TPR domain